MLKGLGALGDMTKMMKAAQEMQGKLAALQEELGQIVVIGGLVSSTALTLLLLPLVYERFGVQADADDTPAQA